MRVDSQEEEKSSDNDSTISPENFLWFQITKRHRNPAAGKVGHYSVMPLPFGLFELNALLMTNYLFVVVLINSIRNILLLAGKCTMCSKFKGLF